MPLSWNSINTFPAESVDDTWITSGWSFATNFRPLASKFWNTAASRLPRPTTVVPCVRLERVINQCPQDLKVKL
jgi:hypothetical protein